MRVGECGLKGGEEVRRGEKKETPHGEAGGGCEDKKEVCRGGHTSKGIYNVIRGYDKGTSGVGAAGAGLPLR